MSALRSIHGHYASRQRGPNSAVEEERGLKGFVEAQMLSWAWKDEEDFSDGLWGEGWSGRVERTKERTFQAEEMVYIKTEKPKLAWKCKSWKCYSLSRVQLFVDHCSAPGSSVHGISQARMLEGVAMPSSRGSSWLGTEPGSPALQADSLPFEPPGRQETLGKSSVLLRPKWWDTAGEAGSAWVSDGFWGVAALLVNLSFSVAT